MQIIGIVNLLENAPEMISEGPYFKIFPGEHAPRPRGYTNSTTCNLGAVK